MRWSPQPASGLHDLILFDGDCVLCSHWARWVHEHDGPARFRFVALQSEAGRALADRYGIDATNPQSNIVVLSGVAHFKLDAACAVLRALGDTLMYRALSAPPRPVRDWLYDRIARNRYWMFGRRPACLAPEAGMRARLIDKAADLKPA